MLVRKYDSISMAKKLPMTIVFFSVSVALLSAALAFSNQRSHALSEAEVRLQQSNNALLASVQQWLDGVENELITQASNPHTADAVLRFTEDFSNFADPLADLQALYIQDNPNPTGSKHLLDTANDGSPYSQAHADFHGFFRDVLNRYGYYDIFLISPNGDIVYTVFKELDYATNLETGAYADSGLADAFRLGLELEAGEIAFVDYAPYAPSFGAPAAFLSTPIYDASGSLAGVLAYQLPSDRLLSLISNPDGLGETGELFLLGEDLASRAGSRLGTVMDVLAPLPELPQLTSEAFATVQGVEGVSGHSVMSVSAPIDVFGVTWRAATEVHMAEILAPVNAALLKISVQILICSIVVGLCARLLSKTISVPLQKVRDAIQRIANGEYDMSLRATDRGDEIGFIANTLMDLCKRLKASDELEAAARAEQEAQAKVVDAISGSLAALAQGNLDCQIETEFPEEYERLRRDFNHTADELAKTIQTVIHQATRIREGAGEVSQSADDLSQRTETQAATLEETAAAIEELAQSVTAAASSAQEVEGIVKDAKSHAEASGEVVQSAVSTMSQIEESSGQIVQIIGVIDDIAFQTSLLALNAGVEAARAGEAGRGFAVVASEVRALAQRSSDAAKEIKTLISSSNVQVQDGAAQVTKAGEALHSIVERVAHISSLMTEIAQGASEQAVSLSEVNTGVSSLDRVTQQNAAMVQETTSTAHALDTESDDLMAAVRHFQLSKPSVPRAGHGSSVSAAA